MRNPAQNGALLSCEEVGRILGITASRVNQIERSAIHKLRAGLAEYANIGRAKRRRNTVRHPVLDSKGRQFESIVAASLANEVSTKTAFILLNSGVWKRL
jgi:hypothetical protein